MAKMNCKNCKDTKRKLAASRRAVEELIKQLDNDTRSLLQLNKIIQNLKRKR